MADYYPLLAKAVASLKDPTPEARQAIYERARKALSGQLRSLDPPIPEEAIEREAQALEVAVAQLETEVAAHSTSENVLRPAESDPYALRPSAGSPMAISQANGPNAPPPEPFEPNAKSQAGFLPSELAEDTSKPPRTSPLRVRRKASEKRLKEAADYSATPPFETGPTWPGSDGIADPSNPEPELLASQASDLSGSTPGPERSNGLPKMRVEGHSSFALESQRGNGQKKRLIALVSIVGLFVTLIGIAAYRLRDRPEDLVHVQPPPVQGEAAPQGKIADRVGGNRVRPGSSSSSTGVSDPERSGTVAVNPPLPVARRAALLVQAPDEPNKVSTYTGTVIWRAENVSSGPDEPLRTAVHAEIEIPEEKFRAEVMIQKNFDGTLPASHTVKLVFVVPDGSPLGNIKQISALQMRQKDTPTGETLKGITVPVVENSFLIGLARGDAEASNLERLRSREWLDVPMVLANGRIAKLTFEKGPSGQRAFDDAIASWRAQ
jgi:hypothetical protein